MAPTIDGTLFNATGTNVLATLLNGDLSIVAVNPTTNENLIISFIDVSEGTFDLSSSNSNTAVTYNINTEPAYSSNFEDGSGQLTITSLDVDNLLVSGTFEFVGKRQISLNDPVETIAITSGSFTNLPLTTTITESGNNTFSANIDGAPFDPDFIAAVKAGDVIGISAINNTTDQSMGISLPTDIEVGTYNFDSLPLQGSIIGQFNVDVGGTTPPYVSLDGSITISSYDPTAGTIEGTFFFTAGDFLGMDDTTFDITDGEFSLEIL